MKLIDNPIDYKYDHLVKSNDLKIFVINPIIVNPQWDKLPSNINDFSIETFSNKLFYGILP